MSSLKRFARGFLLDDRGQGTVEWVLITALVVIAIMILIYAFRDKIKEMMKSATDTMSGWTT
jgi:Flp pilus assembly pilin Flp